MSNERCLYTLLHAHSERHDSILRELVGPVVREVRNAPELDSLFFARYNKPDWQLRFRVLGRPAWVDGPVRELLAGRLALGRERGLYDSHEFATYQREYERYGGPEGMRLSEQIFLHDSLACLELIDADGEGLLAKSRREFSLVMTERFLDLLGFERARRIAYYRFSYSWAVDMKAWEEDELGILDRRYGELRDGLVDLLAGEQARDPDAQWGGPVPRRIAEACLAAHAPVVEELLAAHRAGRVEQDLVHLAWSLTHMHCNRLGVDANAEAILRYFLHRLYEDGALGSA